MDNGQLTINTYQLFIVNYQLIGDRFSESKMQFIETF